MTSPKQSSKRQKKESFSDLAKQSWEHYRNYLDSLNPESNDPSGDIDELQEVIEICKDHVSPKNLPPLEQWNSVENFLPMLLSVCYFHLAESAIADYLVLGNSADDRAKNIQSLLIQSLEYYPQNAATWSMGANFGRMTHLLTASNSRQWYERAAEYASTLRSKGLDILGDDSIEDEFVKEWVELLVLNQVVGVEFEVDDDDEEDNMTDQEEIEAGSDEKEGGTEDDDEEETEEDGFYSASAVEGTARFMCAMLGSMEGRHAEVMKHLKYFGLTHRLHPNVWKIASHLPNEKATGAPLMFAPKHGLLPSHLYKRMKALLSPDSNYWKESNYMARDYYSFFMDYDKDRAEPRNLMEDVIVNHLLPRAKQVLSKEDADSICGFEWWAHTRPISANLGHNLHFDTDEAMLAQEGKVTHPIISSVLYLTGGGSEIDAASPGGATIILDQVPDAREVAAHCWQGVPVDNSFLLFPGNFLHGVLPCPGEDTHDKDIDIDPSSDADTLLWKDWKEPKTRNSDTGTRLTFMVGFWTRNVPKTMKERHLYGPCGPIPPSSDEHTWVNEMCKGYGGNGQECTEAPPHMDPLAIRKVSPAWQPVQNHDMLSGNDQLLIIPKSIDHRFFVKDAPRCFYESLFEETEHSPPSQ